MVRTDIVRQSFEASLDFLRASPKDLFMDFFRTIAFAFAVLMACLIFFGGLGLLGYYLFQGSAWLIFAAIPFFVIAFLVIFLADHIASSPLYNLIEARFMKRQEGIIENAMRNAVPVSGYSLLVTAVKFIIAAPLALIIFGGTFVLAFSVPALMDLLINLADAVFRLVILVPFSIIDFFLLFAIFELLLNRKGVIESIRTSISLAKGNFWETILFQIILFVVMLLVGCVTTLALIIALIPIVLIAVVAGFAGSLLSPMVGWIIGIALGVLIYLPVAVAINAATLMVSLSCVYIYWCKLTGRQAGAAAPSVSTT